MGLSGQQRKELQDALIDAFPDTTSLERMLAYELDKNLTAIAGVGNLQDIVFKLIQTANSQGWVEDLALKAHKYNSGNFQLKAIVENILNNIPTNEYPSEYNHLNNTTDNNSRSPLLISIPDFSNKNRENENIKPNNTPKKFISLTISTIIIAFLSTVLFSAKFLESKKNTKITANIQTSASPSVLALSSRDYYNLARDRYSKKDYEGTVQYYTKAIELNPKNAYAYANRGLARSYLKDYDGALEDYNQAIKLEECGCFYEKRASLFLKRENSSRAIKDYQEAAYLYRQKKDNTNYQKVLEKLKELCISGDNGTSSRCTTFNYE
jgi:tetratricopeptide (TPR) repeat protein